jgi:hypothetical protein
LINNGRRPFLSNTAKLQMRYAHLINNGRRPFLSNTAKLQMRYAHLKFNPLALSLAAPHPANPGRGWGLRPQTPLGGPGLPDPPTVRGAVLFSDRNLRVWRAFTLPGAVSRRYAAQKPRFLRPDAKNARVKGRCASNAISS